MYLRCLRLLRGAFTRHCSPLLAFSQVRQVIQDLSTNDPKSIEAGRKAMNDPVMGAKIQKLIAAGVLQTG